MISFLKGVIIEKRPPELIVDVNGVGYLLTASMNTFYDLPAEGEAIHIYTRLIVREDAQLLFGFSRERERRLFTMLIKVNGVGPKMAITILSSINTNDFVNCIHDDDTATLIRLPGVGKKTAERLLIDMRDRLKDWQVDSIPSIDGPGKQDVTLNEKRRDAISALMALGYKPNEAKHAISQITNTDLSSEELIRRGLKNLVK